MSWAACRRPSRREVLAGGALLALAGCLPGSDQAPPPDPELRTRARIAEEVRALARRYGEVSDRFPAARPELAALAAEHEAHARALLGTSPSAAPSSSPSGSSPASPSPPAAVVPATLVAALAWLADAERAGARRRSRQAARASPALARLLASVAGCEAAHAALLARPEGS